MPRQNRYIVPELPHHVIQRGNNHQFVFHGMSDIRFFLERLRAAAARAKTRVGSYCVMSNHVHLLLYPATEVGLILTTKRLFQDYSVYYNRRYSRSGKLWENRYKLHLVDPDYTWVVSRYIELNPVRAGMVTRAEEHMASSARAHLCGAADRYLTQDILESRSKDYREFVEEVSEARLAEESALRRSIRLQRPHGSPEFVRAMEDRFQTPFTSRPRGRPRNGSPSRTSRGGGNRGVTRILERPIMTGS